MGLFSKKKQTIGYRYTIGMHNIMSLGATDELKEIRFDDVVAWSGSVTSNSEILINEPYLFGGDDREGGVQGLVDVEFGEASQGRNSYLQGELGSDIPAFRNKFGLVFKSFYYGTTAYVKPLSAIMKRIDKQADYTPQWYPAKAAIGEDINPIHIIRECIVSPLFGINNVDSSVDDASFMEAADTLFDEGIGLSFVFDQSKTSVSKFIGDIRDIIDASIYQDISDGKWYIKLIRDDYTVGNLEEFGEDDIIEIRDFSRPSSSELINDVSVNFTDRSNNYKKRVAGSSNIANINSQGRRIHRSLNYYGIHSPSIASTIAAREVKQSSSGVFKCIVVGNRKFLEYSSGDVFILNYPAWGISSVVVRVLDVDYGEIADNKITLNVLEDIFGVDNALYAPPQGSGWQDPVTDPVDNQKSVITDMNYYELVKTVGEATAQSFETGVAYGMTLVPQEQGQSTGFDAWIDSGTGYTFTGAYFYMPSGVIGQSLDDSISDIVVTLGAHSGLDTVPTGSSALCDGEFMKVKTVNPITGQVTLARGVLDTIPISHLTGQKIIFMANSEYVDSIQYTVGTSYSNKNLIKTSKSTLSIGSATEYSITLSERFSLPYPPAEFSVVDSGDIVSTWKTRNRVSGYNIEEQGDATQTGEVGQTHTITIFDGITQIRQETGIIGDTYTYTKSEQRTDFGLTATGTTTPDVTGSYAETGTNDGKPTYYDGSTYYAWWNTANTRWFISDTVGSIPTDGFELINADPEGIYSPIGTFTGTPTMQISTPTLTFKLKSVRDGFDSLTEWDKTV